MAAPIEMAFIGSYIIGSVSANYFTIFYTLGIKDEPPTRIYLSIFVLFANFIAFFNGFNN